MDHVPHFRREILAFEAAVRQVPGEAPLVPSCAATRVTSTWEAFIQVRQGIVDDVARTLR